MESWNDRAPAPLRSLPRLGSSDRLRAALDAIAQTLTSPSFSLDQVRRTVVRYGNVARDQALQIDEMIATLTRGLRDVLDALPDRRRADVLASVQWWAVHGYHRAD